MNLRAPKPRTQFRRLRERLALFHVGSGAAEAHQPYWRGYWTDAARERLLRRGAEGDLGEIAGALERWLPRDLPVLDAGCGPAHMVAALRVRGYQALGIDSESEVVRFVNEVRPDLDVRVGDVLELPFADASLGAYLSLGVVEHFEDGPAAALAEARRVLDPRGVALISVPYLNPARHEHLRRLGGEPARDAARFHQYYFGMEEFTALLRQAGLRVVETLPYAVEAFLTREHPVMARFWRSPLCRGRVRRPLLRAFRGASAWARARYGHMILFVSTPTG